MTLTKAGAISMDNNLVVTGTASVESTSTFVNTVNIGGAGAGYENGGSGMTVTDLGVMSMNGALLVAGTTTLIGQSKHSAGLITGDGFGNTGMTLTNQGALSMEDALTVSGTASVAYSVTLGGSPGTDVKIQKGYGNNGLTLSAAGGISMDSILKVDGAASMNAKTFLNAAVDLGSVKTDDILIKGDLSASSSTNPDITFVGTAGTCAFTCGR